MKRFQNILVGVDLLVGDRLVGDALLAPSEEAVRQALWVAAPSGARVTLMYSLDISERAQRFIAEAQGDRTVADDAHRALEKLMRQAAARGVAVSTAVAYGKPWIEITRQAVNQGHDLVVVGTCARPAASRVLFGSTSMKLLRHCPCPVWATKPSPQQKESAVLVAHDLTPVGTLALELGASLSELSQAPLHVIHALPHEQGPPAAQLGAAERAGSDLAAEARAAIEAELRDCGFAAPAKIVVVQREPAEAILNYAEEHRITLLAMGTVARTGVSGAITGNTAERLLSKVGCSVLAVKPADFQSSQSPDSH